MKIFVKPKSGLKVVRPDTKQPIKPEGELVIKSSYWLRREAEGDVTISAVEGEKSLPVGSQHDDGGEQ